MIKAVQQQTRETRKTKKTKRSWPSSVKEEIPKRRQRAYSWGEQKDQKMHQRQKKIKKTTKNHWRAQRNQENCKHQTCKEENPLSEDDKYVRRSHNIKKRNCQCFRLILQQIVWRRQWRQNVDGRWGRWKHEWESRVHNERDSDRHWSTQTWQVRWQQRNQSWRHQRMWWRDERNDKTDLQWGTQERWSYPGDLAKNSDHSDPQRGRRARCWQLPPNSYSACFVQAALHTAIHQALPKAWPMSATWPTWFQTLTSNCGSPAGVQDVGTTLQGMEYSHVHLHRFLHEGVWQNQAPISVEIVETLRHWPAVHRLPEKTVHWPESYGRDTQRECRFEMKRGTKQGDPLSSFLLNTVLQFALEDKASLWAITKRTASRIYVSHTMYCSFPHRWASWKTCWLTSKEVSRVRVWKSIQAKQNSK